MAKKMTAILAFKLSQTEADVLKTVATAREKTVSEVIREGIRLALITSEAPHPAGRRK